MHLSLKFKILITLFALFSFYTAFVYTKATARATFTMNDEAFKGKMLYQKFNCTACHQLYGLGGYLGPELTSAYSQKAQNDAYFAAILKNGTLRMPDFNLSDKEVNQVIEYLKYIDQTSTQIPTY